MLFRSNVVNVLGAICGSALLFHVDGPLPIVVAGTVMGIGNGIMLPNAIAGAVSIRPQAAGTASGLLGCTQMLFGALTSQFAGHLIAGATTPWPMLLHMVAIGIIAVVVFLALIRPHPMPAHK